MTNEPAAAANGDSLGGFGRLLGGPMGLFALGLGVVGMVGVVSYLLPHRSRRNTEPDPETRRGASPPANFERLPPRCQRDPSGRANITLGQRPGHGDRLPLNGRPHSHIRSSAGGLKLRLGLLRRLRPTGRVLPATLPRVWPAARLRVDVDA